MNLCNEINDRLLVECSENFQLAKEVHVFNYIKDFSIEKYDHLVFGIKLYQIKAIEIHHVHFLFCEKFKTRKKKEVI